MDLIQNFNQRLDLIENKIDNRFIETNNILLGYNVTIESFIGSIQSELPNVRVLGIFIVVNFGLSLFILLYLLARHLTSSTAAIHRT